MKLEKLYHFENAADGADVTPAALTVDGEVVAEESPTTTTPPEDGDGGPGEATTQTMTGGSGGAGGIPGFGVGARIVALLCGLLVARRRV